MIERSAVFDAALDLVACVTSTAESSAIVNQAVGIIMQNRACTAEAAIARLAALAASDGQDLRKTAEGIVNGMAHIDEG